MKPVPLDRCGEVIQFPKDKAAVASNTPKIPERHEGNPFAALGLNAFMRSATGEESCLRRNRIRRVPQNVRCTPSERLVARGDISQARRLNQRPDPRIGLQAKSRLQLRAAIDGNTGTGDPARLVRGQERDYICHVFRLADSL